MFNNKTKTPVILAMASAVIVATSLLILIPVPATQGFVTICDAGIYVIAMLFGPLGGLIVGGLSGFLIDILSGAANWALFSAIIHGFQGYLFGYFYSKKKHYTSYIIASLFMIFGYTLATFLMFGFTASLLSIPANCVQIIFSIILSSFLSKKIKTLIK